MGSGYRTFTAGEVLTASNVQNYLQDQVVMTFGGSAARSSAIGTANFEEGMTSYLTDTDKLEVYNGTNWVNVAPTASSGDNWTLQNSGGTSLTGAQTITVSGISGKNKIMVLISEGSSASASSTFMIRLNGDTGNNYAMFGQAITAASSYSANNFSREATLTNDGWFLAIMSNNAASKINGYCLITGCNSSGVKVMNLAGAGNPDGGTGHRNYDLGGYYNSSSAITSVSIFSGTGNFDAGTIYVYTSE
jgi:hypothetical protein